MLKSLQLHAIQNVWCSPQQDNQSIIRPARLSPTRGAKNYQRVLWQDIPVPVQGERFHVYQIGHIHPHLLGLLDLSVEWTTLQTIINNDALIGEIYLLNGRILPHFDCYFRWDRHRNLLLAVRERSHFSEIRDKKIEMRLYTNAYYASSRFTQSTTTYTNGRVVEQDTDRSNLRSEMQTYQNLSYGHVFIFRNGYLVEDLLARKVNTGDIIEFVFDGSVDFTVDLDVSDLRTFLSQLDSQNKYLLHYPGVGNQRIEYQDDVDVYVLRKDDTYPNRHEGVYYMRNDSASLRMVTHKDYSMPVSLIANLQQENVSQLGQLNDLTVRLYIRDSGFDRPLIFDNRRMFELYRLPNDQVLDAMLSTNESLSLWSAPTLENSPYPKLMRNRERELPTHLVEQAYGYNSIAHVLGDTPQTTTVQQNGTSAKLEPAYRYKATIYEYDSNGLLLGFYTINNHINYPCRNSESTYIEAMVGHASQTLDVTFGERTKVAEDHLHYRVYLCTLEGDTPLWDWQDITDTAQVSRSNGEIQIDDSIDLTNKYSAILSDDHFIGYTSSQNLDNGVIHFTIQVNETHDGVTQLKDSTIPLRQIHLWMNGYSLIQDLDYFVNWPDIVITNESYIDHNANSQQITIKAIGFTNDQLETEKHREKGFVQHGYLGSTQRYHIRDDITYSLIINGRLVLRDQIEWAQYNDGAQVGAYPDGSPYAIKETIVALRNEFYNDVYAIRDQSRTIDDQVSQYMDVYFSPQQLPDPPFIESLYSVYSPFMARVIELLQQNYIPEQQLIVHKGQYSELQIEQWFDGHFWLLDYDPAYQGVDWHFVSVYPHPFDQAQLVTIYQYNLIKKINSLYFDNKIPLATFLQVTIPQQ